MSQPYRRRFNRRRRREVYEGVITELTYKDVEVLKKFVNDKGKILPRRVTGANAKDQRHIAKVVKQARQVALLPFAKKDV